MGKSARNKRNRRDNPRTRSDVPTFLRGIPEPNLRTVAAAWGLLNVYLHTTVELDNTYPIPDEVSAQDPVGARQLAEGFAQLKPHAVLGLREDAEFFLSRITDVDVAAKAILAEPRAWLRKSGYRPDTREWWAKAGEYVQIMVASADREDALALLDYDNLIGDLAEIDASFDAQAKAIGRTMPPFFSIDDLDPRTNPWYYTVRHWEPKPALRAIAALAVGLFVLPGAVTSPQDVLLSLIKRAMATDEYLIKRDEHANDAGDQPPEPTRT